MNQPAEEGTGGQHHVVGEKTQAHLGNDATHLLLLNDQVIAGLLENPQIGLVLQHVTDGSLVQHTVSLGAGRPYRRALAAVEHTKLDTCLVGRQRHGAAQRIDLFHQVALTDTTDSGVAAHLSQRLDVVTEQQGLHAHTRGCERSFGTGMATTDHNDVKTAGKVHLSPRLPGVPPAQKKGADYRAKGRKLQPC